MVKYTCKSYSRNGGRRRRRAREWRQERAVAKRARGGGTEREARAEPGCAKRQASLRQAHREQTESVHWKCNGANSAQPA